MKHPCVYAIIPARGGSKGVPRKNILPLAGKPLIAHAISSAQQAKRVDRVIVNTDDEEIAEVATAYGAEVPFLRPSYLATDSASLGDVIQHNLRWFEQYEERSPDYFVQLQVTSPFRPDGLIDQLLEQVVEGPYHGAITVRPIHKYLFRDPYFTLSANNTPQLLKHNIKSTIDEPIIFFKPFMLVGVYSRIMPGPPDFIQVIENPVHQIDIDTWDEYLLSQMIVQEGLFELQ